MEAAHRSRTRVLSEIDPPSEWVRGDEFDTLIVDVTGFSKDQLKVQLDPPGSLKISGERAVNGGGRQWLHFLKRFDLPPGAIHDTSAIKVQLNKGVLYIQVPQSGDATGNEQHMEDALQEGETSGGDTWNWNDHAMAARRDGHPAWQLAKGLSRHRHVILNVVLAVVLLWLVAFAKNRQSGGQTKNE